MSLALDGAATLALGCEQRVASELFGNWQPASTITSLAFVLAGLAILVRARGSDRPVVAAHRWFAAVVAAVGIGSVIQHGPYPDWQAYAHDLTLAAVLAFVAVDAASDLLSRRLSHAWWVVATAAVAPFVAIGPAASIAAQVSLAVAAIGLSLLRAWRRPGLRRVLLVALLVLAGGAAIGSIGERTALCQPDSWWQAHAFWHVLAAFALWLLTPAIGQRGAASGQRGGGVSEHEAAGLGFDA